VADILNRVREPFNVNSLAQLAAAAVLDDGDYLARGVAVNNAGRAQLESALTAMGFDFIPSQGNFISFDVSAIADIDGLALYQLLLERGVIVRPITPYGLPQHLRVSIGLEDENAAFIAALSAIQTERLAAGQ
jgi:histidinol-phosphate aminotransferase